MYYILCLLCYCFIIYRFRVLDYKCGVVDVVFLVFEDRVFRREIRVIKVKDVDSYFKYLFYYNLYFFWVFGFW